MSGGTEFVMPEDFFNRPWLSYANPPGKWSVSGCAGNPFRAAFAINLVLWSLGIFDKWID